RTATSAPTTPTPQGAPAPRGRTAARPDVYHDALPIRHRHAGGVALGLRSHWVAAPPLPDGTPQVAEFDTYTDSLEALADWRAQRGVTPAPLEATGAYGDPLFALLQERGFEVILVAPAYTHGIQGRPKTDRRDCQWIQRLHSHGLLPASFRPSAAVTVLRHYLRQRAELVHNGVRPIQHLQKALEPLNRKLAEVPSALPSLTGQKIIGATLKGERDPLRLARRRDQHCHNSAATIARALRGSWRPEALFALPQAWDSWQHDQQQLRAIEDVIAQQWHRMKKSAELPPLPPKPRPRGRKPNEPHFDVRAALSYVSGVDRTELEGLAEVTALVVVSAIGLDRSRFPSVQHFCVWLGLCPVVKQSGRTKKGQKKIQSARIRRGRGRAAQAL